MHGPAHADSGARGAVTCPPRALLLALALQPMEHCPDMPQSSIVYPLPHRAARARWPRAACAAASDEAEHPEARWGGTPRRKTCSPRWLPVRRAENLAALSANEGILSTAAYYSVSTDRGTPLTPHGLRRGRMAKAPSSRPPHRHRLAPSNRSKATASSSAPMARAGRHPRRIRTIPEADLAGAAISATALAAASAWRVLSRRGAEFRCQASEICTGRRESYQWPITRTESFIDAPPDSPSFCRPRRSRPWLGACDAGDCPAAAR